MKILYTYIYYIINLIILTNTFFIYNISDTTLAT